MIRDSYDLMTSTDSDPARQAFEAAVLGVAAHRPSTAAALTTTLAADPDHVGAHALTGFANLLLARSETAAPAATALGRARAALLARDGGTADERILVDALALAEAGYFGAAADRLDAGFADRPALFPPFKIAHALRFMLGDAAGMLAASQRAMAVWDEDLPAAGFLLGCHAFALEEHGRYDAARAAGERAIALEPRDAWGLHAVSHVHEMRGDTARGIDLLEANRDSWSRCNNFSFHVAWHLALFHLERGEHERVLQLYDDEVRPRPSDDFRDMANAVSLLWRLRQSGVAVGGRWHELAEIAHARRADTTLVFAALHNLAALMAVGARKAALELVAAIEAKDTETGDQARVAASVGVPLAHLIAEHGAFADQRALDNLLEGLPSIGGSNAQRDVFVLAVARVAGRRGDRVALSRIESIRHGLRAEDRLFRTIELRA
ncbi:tetratricopeptide repeat protein [uncultured Amaricoccus sp.]|uniref:tetratricopeptide repeat protein n=1 Tax=uncultured Amaricoccus sp. TaxID=339341 RepID=UPI00260F07D3|nr:tetratricopeptide repeat protein [uncultured Amaricoccus sp.]